MLRFFALLFSAVIIIGLSISCRTHAGYVISTPEKTDFRYEARAQGHSKARYWFGIGGLRQTALVDQAKREMYKSRPLKENEAYVNVTIDIQTTEIIIFSKTEIYISADVINYSPRGDDRYSDEYLHYLGITKQNNETPTTRQDTVFYDVPTQKQDKSNAPFSRGDKVIDAELNEYVVMTVGYSKNSLKNLKTREIITSGREVFNTQGEYKGKAVGEKFLLGEEMVEVIGVGFDSYLIKNTKGEVYTANYD
jgi:hypothetical protein